MEREEMNINQLLKDYLNNREPHERKVGRYNSSELYNIMTGEIKPMDFMAERPKFDLKACQNIVEGEIRERALKDLLDFSQIPYEFQTKDVYKGKGFEIVAVADFTFPDRILETKCPTRMREGISIWNKPQLEAQYRIFNKPIYIMYLKERFENKVYKYAPSDKLWELILEKISKFDKAVKLCQKK